MPRQSLSSLPGSLQLNLPGLFRTIGKIGQEYTVQRIVQTIEGPFTYLRFQLAFPDDDDIPAQSVESTIILLISCPVPCKLRFPEFHIRFRYDEVTAALMSMPETTVDEDYRLVFPHHDIRCPGQPSDIHPEPVSTAEQVFAYHQLRLRVLATDPGHALVPLVICHPVCHPSCFCANIHNPGGELYKNSGDAGSPGIGWVTVNLTGNEIE